MRRAAVGGGWWRWRLHWGLHEAHAACPCPPACVVLPCPPTPSRPPTRMSPLAPPPPSHPQPQASSCSWRRPWACAPWPTPTLGPPSRTRTRRSRARSSSGRRRARGRARGRSRSRGRRGASGSRGPAQHRPRSRSRRSRACPKRCPSRWGSAWAGGATRCTPCIRCGWQQGHPAGAPGVQQGPCCCSAALWGAVGGSHVCCAARGVHRAGAARAARVRSRAGQWSRAGPGGPGGGGRGGAPGGAWLRARALQSPRLAGRRGCGAGCGCLACCGCGSTYTPPHCAHAGTH